MSESGNTIYLPSTDSSPAEPAPYVLTEADLVRMLRLDCQDPYQAIYRYRRRGQLKGTQVGKQVRFLLPDVVKFLDRAREENPR